MWGKLLVLGLALWLLTGASYEPGRRSSVYLFIDRVGTIYDGICTGTVVGPKTILTAEHCFTDELTSQTLETGMLKVDNDSVRAYTIVASDNHDHVLVRIEDGLPAGKRIAKFGTFPTVGQPIYLWGNPNGVRGVLRIGYVRGFRYNLWGLPMITMVEFHTRPGDSGAAYFNSKGEIVGVHYGSHPTDAYAVGVKLQFMPKQLALAAKP